MWLNDHVPGGVGSRFRLYNIDARLQFMELIFVHIYTGLQENVYIIMYTTFGGEKDREIKWIFSFLFYYSAYLQTIHTYHLTEKINILFNAFLINRYNTASVSCILPLTQIIKMYAMSHYLRFIV